MGRPHVPTPKECMDGREVIKQVSRYRNIQINGDNGSSHVPMTNLLTGESMTVVRHETGIGLACKWAKTLAKWGVLFSSLYVGWVLWTDCPAGLYSVYVMLGG